MKFTNARGVFLSYRAGEISYDEVMRKISDEVDALAGYMLGRWRCRLNGRDDLRQEISIAIWRALDEWDPERGVTIDRFVSYRAGNAAEKRLAYAAGWPRKGRRPPAKACAMPEDAESFMGGVDADAEALASMREVLAQNPEFAELARYVADAGGVICDGMRVRAAEIATSADDVEQAAESLTRRYRYAASKLGAQIIESRC